MNVKSYKDFLKSIEKATEGYEYNGDPYVRTPKKLLADPNLTATEKILWITLTSFMFTSTKSIFPSRDRLSLLMDVKSLDYISKLTRILQDKGYLTKHTQRPGTLVYTPYYRTDVDDESFTFPVLYQQKESKYNRIKIERLSDGTVEKNLLPLYKKRGGTT